MDYICMICGRRRHVLREGKVMLCTRCITALGLALGEKLPRHAEEGKRPPCQPEAQGRRIPHGDGIPPSRLRRATSL